MIERKFQDIRVMLNEIRNYTDNYKTYVVYVEDYMTLKMGWYCPTSDIFFYVYGPFLKMDDPVSHGIYNNIETRHLLSINLSNCSTKDEYDKLREKINKLKPFW